MNIMIDLGHQVKGYCKASDLREQIGALRANSNSMIPRVCERIGCRAVLTYERNYRNVFCWNCLYKLCLEKHNTRLAEEIAEMYL